eukprot:924615_1
MYSHGNKATHIACNSKSQHQIEEDLFVYVPCDVFWETPYLVLFFPENCMSKEVNSIGCMLCNCVLFILFKFICVLFCVCICNELQKGHIFILLIMNTLLVLFSFWGIWYHFTGGFSLHDVIEKK